MTHEQFLDELQSAAADLDEVLTPAPRALMMPGDGAALVKRAKETIDGLAGHAWTQVDLLSSCIALAEWMRSHGCVPPCLFDAEKAIAAAKAEELQTV